MANRRLKIGTAVALIVFSIASVGLYLLARDSFSQSHIRELIQAAYNRQRPGGGRLSGSRYTPLPDKTQASADLGTAQILILRLPDSDARQALQGELYLAAGDWQQFATLAENRASQVSDVATLNNLGTTYLALAVADPTFFLKALNAFERASVLAPSAPEPLFNLVITYRKLHFSKLAEDKRRRYAQLDDHSPWYDELSHPSKNDEAEILEELKRAVETNDIVTAEYLFNANPELCRRTAMDYAFHDEEESRPLLSFIAAQMEKHYRDKTISAMLSPMFSDQRQTTIAIREAVNRGADSYTHGNFQDSLAAYEEADKLSASTTSDFDQLWIDLNRVDTQIRLRQFDDARKSLTHVISSAQASGYVWLAAKATSIYGASVLLTSSYAEMIDLVSKADRAFIGLDAPHDRIRVLYYLAFYRYAAGDVDEALRLALECVRLVGDDEVVRIYTLDWLIGSILYRRGLSDQAVLFAKESVEKAQTGSYPAAEASAATSLVDLYESLSQLDLAEQYLKIAESAFERIPESPDRDKAELMLDFVKARTLVAKKQYTEAETLLKRDIDYAQKRFVTTNFLAQALMLSAQIYTETGRTNDAAKKFNEAIDLVENDDDYLKSEGLRVKFDDERRQLYDSAIEFEFDHGATDAAWTHLQKYRAKLFLEFLAAFDPNIEQTHASLNPRLVQKRIPKDTQIVEYALLKDRLLIWVMTDALFTVRSVSVKRSELEDQIENTLKKLRADTDDGASLLQLGKVLIDPVSDLLDPRRTLIIIPDRALHGLPFGALRLAGKNEYLIEEFPVVISPSLTHLLAGTEHIRETPRNGIVGFGSQNGAGSEMKELHALSEIYERAELYSGQQVDKVTFLSEISKAAIFHYAGHSATDAADPLRSSILLDGNRSGPNSVTAVDISKQRLANNAVVILSSCDSSVGNSRDGIGVRGLTSAFLIGGAGSVVGSLWPVEANSTAELMIRFHQAFKNGHMPVAKALREAQLSLLHSSHEQAHPYYWSGFVVTGNFSALR